MHFVSNPGRSHSGRCTASLVAPYRAILRYYRCDTPYRAILFQGGCTPPKWCDTPPWYLVSHRHICAIPHFATYRAIIVRYPTKTSTKENCDTIAASIARYEKYRYNGFFEAGNLNSYISCTSRGDLTRKEFLRKVQSGAPKSVAEMHLTV